MIKYDTNKFIENSKLKHGDKYDYSLVEYKNMKSKVSIKCSKGHVFEQMPHKHLIGQGCRICSKLNKFSNFNDFLLKSIDIHKNKFNYDKFIYTDSKNKSIITCSIHGDFTQSPNAHLSGKGCRKCYYESKLEKNIVSKFKLIHGSKYSYVNVKYVNSDNFIDIICPEHGSFLQKPYSHLEGSGCPKCSVIGKKVSFKEFIERSKKIHGNIFTYNSESFINMTTKMIINCKKHGDFKITPDSHIGRRRGCPKCSNSVSNLELNWLDKIGIDKVMRHKSIKIENKIFHLDAVDLENKIIYEFYGDFWHGNPKIYKENDINPFNKKKFSELYKKTIEREEYLKSFGYNIISIWETDYKKLIKL